MPDDGSKLPAEKLIGDAKAAHDTISAFNRWLKPTLESAGTMRSIAEQVNSSRIDQAVFDFEPFIDRSPAITAENTYRMVEAVSELVKLTASSLALSDKTERFTCRMSWASLVIAVASLGIAAVAIFT